MRFSGGGCQPCKSRRKKCDESRPICQRCAKARRVCFGYESEFATVHNENTFASGQLKRPRGPRSKVEPHSLGGVVLSRDVRAEAVAYYMHHHLEPVKDASALIDSPREPLLAMLNSAPVLHLALSSIALALFSRTRQCPSAELQSFVNYRKSLHALKDQIRSLNPGSIDACLLAICLLSRYEDAVCIDHLENKASIIKMLKSRSHHVGAMAVLKYWENSCELAKNPTTTIKYARRVVRKSALLRTIDLPEWLRDGVRFGESGKEQALDQIIIRIIRLRTAFSAFLTQREMSQPDSDIALSIIQTALAEAVDIDQALTRWIRLYDYGTQRKCHDLAPPLQLLKGTFYRSPIYSYRNHSSAAIYAQYYGYRLLAKQLEIQVLEARDLETKERASPECLNCKQTLGFLANELASTIPFCLERFTPSNNPVSAEGGIQLIESRTRKPYVVELVVTPLFLASVTGDIDTDLREWFSLQLGDVGRLLGYGILEIAGTMDLSAT